MDRPRPLERDDDDKMDLSSSKSALSSRAGAPASSSASTWPVECAGARFAALSPEAGTADLLETSRSTGAEAKSRAALIRLGTDTSKLSDKRLNRFLRSRIT